MTAALIVLAIAAVLWFLIGESLADGPAMGFIFLAVLLAILAAT